MANGSSAVSYTNKRILQSYTTLWIPNKRVAPPPPPHTHTLLTSSVIDLYNTSIIRNPKPGVRALIYSFQWLCITSVCRTRTTHSKDSHENMHSIVRSYLSIHSQPQGKYVFGCRPNLHNSQLWTSCSWTRCIEEYEIITLIRAHGLLNRAHGLVIRAHDLVIRAHGLA